MDIQTELVMHYILTLSSGKDYTMELDVDQFVADTKAYYETEMPSLIKQSLMNQGYTEEEIESIVKEQGYSSYDEFAEANLKIVLESLEQQFSESDSVLSKGTYTSDGQKISLKDTAQDAVVAEGKIGSDGALTFEIPVNGVTRTAVFKK